ncbi:receptor-like protein kinase, partial [Trifolium medium]|nr:receptor-like protein kinase [Trifolium medium]
IFGVPSIQDSPSSFRNYCPLTGNSTSCLSHSSLVGSWVLDSGAADHIAGNPSLSFKRHITLVDGSTAKVTGVRGG